MKFERFGMWVFVVLGRILVIVGSLAVVQRFFVERNVTGAFVTAILYGGGLIGFGAALGKMGRLGLAHQGKAKPED